MTDVVQTTGLTKRFGDTTVVSDVELRVPRGTAFGYLKLSRGSARLSTSRAFTGT